jgi:hypothetical protein
VQSAHAVVGSWSASLLPAGQSTHAPVCSPSHSVPAAQQLSSEMSTPSEQRTGRTVSPPHARRQCSPNLNEPSALQSPRVVPIGAETPSQCCGAQIPVVSGLSDAQKKPRAHGTKTAHSWPKLSELAQIVATHLKRLYSIDVQQTSLNSHRSLRAMLGVCPVSPVSWQIYASVGFSVDPSSIGEK